MTDLSERERLIRFMDAHEMTYKDLARQMKWSPTFIFGALGGAWSLTDSFRWAFAKTFGFEAAAQIFNAAPRASQVEE